MAATKRGGIRGTIPPFSISSIKCGKASLIENNGAKKSM
jgi:hypothetical protein